MRIGPFLIKNEVPQKVADLISIIPFNKFDIYDGIFNFGTDDTDGPLNLFQMYFSSKRYKEFCIVHIRPIGGHCDIFIMSQDIEDPNSLENRFLNDLIKMAKRYDPNVEIEYENYPKEALELDREKYETLDAIQETTGKIETTRDKLRVQPSRIPDTFELILPTDGLGMNKSNLTELEEGRLSKYKELLPKYKTKKGSTP